MNAEQAREIVLQAMQDIADDEYPLPWVGDLLWENSDTFVFAATIHSEAENPLDDYQHWGVDKTTGQCSAIIYGLH